MRKIKQFKHTEYLNSQIRPPPPLPPPPPPTNERFGEGHSVFNHNATWSSLGLHPQIVQHVEKLYPHPTHIQSVAIPVMLKGKDVIGVSETGSGKSAAFILPILHFMLTQKDNVSPCTALILTPTRELALQIENHCNSLGKLLDLKTCHLIGGETSAEQKYTLEKTKPHIVIESILGVADIDLNVYHDMKEGKTPTISGYGDIANQRVYQDLVTKRLEVSQLPSKKRKLYHK